MSVRERAENTNEGRKGKVPLKEMAMGDTYIYKEYLREISGEEERDEGCHGGN